MAPGVVPPPPSRHAHSSRLTTNFSPLNGRHAASYRPHHRRVVRHWPCAGQRIRRPRVRCHPLCPQRREDGSPCGRSPRAFRHHCARRRRRSRIAHRRGRPARRDQTPRHHARGAREQRRLRHVRRIQRRIARFAARHDAAQHDVARHAHQTIPARPARDERQGAQPFVDGGVSARPLHGRLLCHEGVRPQLLRSARSRAGLEASSS